MNTNGAKPSALWAYDLFLANKETIWKAEIFIGMEFGSKLALQKDLSLLAKWQFCMACAKVDIGKF